MARLRASQARPGHWELQAGQHRPPRGLHATGPWCVSTSFANISLLLAKQRVEPVTSWQAAEKQLEAWGVFCHIFLGNAVVPPPP